MVTQRDADSRSLEIYRAAYCCTACHIHCSHLLVLNASAYLPAAILRIAYEE